MRSRPSGGGWSPALDALHLDDLDLPLDQRDESEARAVDELAADLVAIDFPKVIVARERHLDLGANPERDAPVAGLLGDICTSRIDRLTWDTALIECAATRALLAEVHAVALEMDHRARRRVGVIAAAALMVPWLEVMPFVQGNLWCAEVHGLATLRQFDVRVAPGGIGGGSDYFKDGLGDAYRRVIVRQPDSEAPGSWKGLIPDDLSEGLTRWPAVSDLALALFGLPEGR